MTKLADGLTYNRSVYRDSLVHLLTIDLSRRQVRPVLAADQFPFLRIYPVVTASNDGALASVGGGFNTTWFHHQGVADEPLHAMVIDREIFTTGTGAGGFGVLFGVNDATTRLNHIQTILWRPDHTAINVEKVNRGHDGHVLAFNWRGGTNEYPMEGKHYVLLNQPSDWVDDGEAMHRHMTVQAVTMFKSLQPTTPDDIVIESRWPLKLTPGDVCQWTQRLGAPGIHTIVSGWPEIAHDGVNRVPSLDLHGVASNGPDNWFIRKNPRMAVGVNEPGSIMFLITVEGRIPTSTGLRLKELATLMLQHGIYSAVNFDGGGSAFMWTKQDGLVADSCYGDGTLQGLRPDHFAIAVF